MNVNLLNKVYMFSLQFQAQLRHDNTYNVNRAPYSYNLIGGSNDLTSEKS